MRRALPWRRRKKRWQRILIALSVTALLLFVAVKADHRISLLLDMYGDSMAKQDAMLAAHSGMEEVLAADPVTYDDLVEVRYDTGGNIKSVETNIAPVNVLKSRATEAIQRHMNEHENSVVMVPLGFLVDESYFSNRGPRLRVPISIIGNVTTDLVSTFESAGVNQTRHSLSMKVTIIVATSIAAYASHITVETSFLIAETVLVGQVPSSYAQLDLGQLSVAGNKK